MRAKNTPIEELREHVNTMAPGNLDRELAKEFQLNQDRQRCP
jgi:hypothetical protein